jgi:hypothetical protein
MRSHPHSLCAVLALASLSVAQQQLYFPPPLDLSDESEVGAPAPGEDADKGKIVMLTNTLNSARDRRLVVAYGEAASTGQVWDLKGQKARHARDIFTRYSDDMGQTWSAPVNVSRTANLFSSRTDWDGDGELEEYWGDSAKPTIFSSGDNIVLTWGDKYAPEPSWNWGDTGQSTIQGSVLYPDLATYPFSHTVPYSCVYAAVSTDGGTTWTYGEVNPPLQLTYASRDAIQDTNKGDFEKWVITWQEDPEGLKSGEGEGPGEGYSGAIANKGTDVWYTWTDDLVNNAAALRTNRVPLTNHTRYDRSNGGEYAIVGTAGGVENHASTRANLDMEAEGGVLRAVVAYEETKGVSGVLEGKTVQYHSFPFDAPLLDGPVASQTGDAGTMLSPFLENSRRVRFVVQPPDGVRPAVAIFWKQGVGDQGGPSDIMVRVSKSFDPAAVAAANVVNLSSKTPIATPATLADSTSENPIEDARAHRAALRGQTLIIGYTYTANQALAIYTDLDNYNFWVRRSLDGGANWLAPQNVSNITDTRINVKEPRLLKTPGIGVPNPNAYMIAWGTETNPYQGIANPKPIDVRVTYSLDRCATFAKVTDMAASFAGDYETQLRPNEDLTEVYAVWMSEFAGATDLLYSTGRRISVPPSLGTLYCFGDGAGTPCPCGNESAANTGAGCANSTGLGALLTASGSTSLTADDLVLLARNLPPSRGALLLSSAFKRNAGFGLPFRDGLLCLEPNVQRYALVNSDAAGMAQWGPGLGSNHTNWTRGTSLLFQVWCRDGGGPCGFGANTSNGLEIALLP